MKKFLIALPLVLLVACTQNQNRQNPTGDNESPDLIVSVENATFGGNTAVNVSQADLQINGKLDFVTLYNNTPNIDVAEKVLIVRNESSTAQTLTFGAITTPYSIKINRCPVAPAQLSAGGSCKVVLRAFARKETDGTLHGDPDQTLVITPETSPVLNVQLFASDPLGVQGAGSPAESGDWSVVASMIDDAGTPDHLLYRSDLYVGHRDVDFSNNIIRPLKYQQIVVTNNSARTVPANTLVASVSGPYSIRTNRCIAALAPGKTCKITFVWSNWRNVAIPEAGSITFRQTQADPLARISLDVKTGEQVAHVITDHVIQTTDSPIFGVPSGPISGNLNLLNYNNKLYLYGAHETHSTALRSFDLTAQLLSGTPLFPFSDDYSYDPVTGLGQNAPSYRYLTSSNPQSDVRNGFTLNRTGGFSDLISASGKAYLGYYDSLVGQSTCVVDLDVINEDCIPLPYTLIIQNSFPTGNADEYLISAQGESVPGVSGDVDLRVYKLNVDTGVLTHVGLLGGPGVNNSYFYQTSSGDLYVAKNERTAFVKILDPSNATSLSTVIDLNTGIGPFIYNDSMGVVFKNNKIYNIARNSSTNQFELISYNIDTQALTIVDTQIDASGGLVKDQGSYVLYVNTNGSNSVINFVNSSNDATGLYMTDMTPTTNSTVRLLGFSNDGYVIWYGEREFINPNNGAEKITLSRVWRNSTSYTLSEGNTIPQMFDGFTYISSYDNLNYIQLYRFNP